jgi:hypothetical protein
MALEAVELIQTMVSLFTGMVCTFLFLIEKLLFVFNRNCTRKLAVVPSSTGKRGRFEVLDICVLVDGLLGRWGWKE